MSVVSNRADAPARSGRREMQLKRLLLLTIVAALFGQPNAFFVYFSFFPLLLTVLLLVLTGCVLYHKLKTPPFSLPRTNLTWPTLIFFAYSLVSLTYAPDSFFGARILFSTFFKFLLFFVILAIGTREDDMKKYLYVVVLLGGLFSLQALVYVIGFVFFNLPPGDYISSVPGYGAHGYDPGINSLGILGFAKVTNKIGTFRLPRGQAMFLEPGFFATYLELSIFATLGWSALAGNAHKRFTGWLLGLQFGALIFTFSSAGWFAIGAGLVVYVALRLFIRPGVLSRSRVTVLLKIAASALGSVVVLGLCFPSLAVNLYNTLYIAKFASDKTELTSASDRLAKATDSISLFSQKPIFGWGSNQLPIISANGASVGNAFLTISTELGVVGLVIYCVMLGAILWTLMDNMRMAYRLQNAAYNGLTAALTGCLTASFIHSMLVDTEWQFSYWISLALVYLNRKLLRGMLAARQAEPVIS
jgi:hypothetical protein